MIARDLQNALIFRYVLMEYCLRGQENYEFIVKKKKYYITALSVLAVVVLLREIASTRQPY